MLQLTCVAVMFVAVGVGLIYLASRYPESVSNAAPAGSEALLYELCPREQRTRPHAVHADGSLTCWQCGASSGGDVR